MNVLPTDSLLYVVFSIRDPELLRAVAQKGLTVWVDPKGRRRHAYGVRYPIGLRAQRVRGGDSEEEASRGTPFDRVFPSDLAVLRNDTLRHRVPARFSTGPRVAATLNTGSLLYELGIPVHSAPADDRRHGLRSSLSRPFSVGLETPESDDSAILKKPSPVSVTGRGRRTRSPRRRRRRRSPSISDQDSELPSLSLWKRVVWGNGQ